MARFYINENVPEQVAVELRRLGHDVLMMRESGHSGRAVPDPEVLDFATANERAVVTHNRRHFIKLHSERPTHAGIVVCTVDANFEALARRIHDAVAETSDLSGHLIRVNRPS